MNHLWYN